MLRCRLVSDFQEVASISKAWDELVAQSDFNDVFATHGFARAWWRAYGQSRLLKVVVVEDSAGCPRLIAPFYSDQAEPDVLRLIGHFRGDYNQLVFRSGDHESLRKLFDWLGRRDDWRTIRLRRIPETSSLLDYFPQAHERCQSAFSKLSLWSNVRFPLAYRHTHADHCYMGVEKLSAFGQLLTAGSLARHVRWFSKQGALTYQNLRDHEDIKRFLPSLKDMHIVQWAAKGQPSLFQQSENCRFYDHLIEELAGYRALRLDILSLNSRIIAAHFGFNWNRRVLGYKWSYDIAFKSHSPGMLLLGFMIRDALGSGATELDFLIGSEAYKERYASATRKTESLHIYRTRLLALRERLWPGNN